VIAGEVTAAPSSGGVVEGSTVEGPGVAATVPEPQRAHPSYHPEVVHGPLSVRALLRVDEALRLADAATGLTFSVYIGELGEDSRDTAQRLHARLADPDVSVLIAISPNERVLEIVTGSRARKRILDRDAHLAAKSMVAAFSGGDLGGGIVAGIAQLADHAGRAPSDN
jgi:Domain of unknown function (DUF477).